MLPAGVKNTPHGLLPRPGCSHDAVPHGDSGPDMLGESLAVSGVGKGMGHAGDGKNISGQPVPQGRQPPLRGQTVGQMKGSINRVPQQSGQGRARKQTDLLPQPRKTLAETGLQLFGTLPVRREKVILIEWIGPQQGFQKSGVGHLAADDGARLHKRVEGSPDGGYMSHTLIKAISGPVDAAAGFSSAFPR